MSRSSLNSPKNGNGKAGLKAHGAAVGSPKSPKKLQTQKEFQALQRIAASMIMRPLARNMESSPLAPDGRPAAVVAETFIKPNDRLTSLERIEIYNRQYWYRLIDCLYDDYPGLLSILGQKKFNKLICTYLEKNPSRSFTLRNLGDRLEQFIIDHPELVHPRQQLAQEMAAFEWAQVVAFDGPEHPAVTVDDLLGKDATKIRLGMQPFITLLDLHYPLDDYTLALKKQQTALRSEASNAVDAPEQISKSIVKLPRKQRTCVAVHRHDNDIYFKRLDPREYALLKAIQNGANIAKAVAAAKSLDPAQVQQWFQSWTQMGWFYLRK